MTTMKDVVLGDKDIWHCAIVPERNTKTGIPKAPGAPHCFKSRSRPRTQIAKPRANLFVSASQSYFGDKNVHNNPAWRKTS